MRDGVRYRPEVAPKKLKPPVLPPGFILIIDSREQEPYFIKDGKPILGIPMIRVKLGAGDYSVKGFENSISIERKSLTDFYNCVGNSRTRFEKELERLQSYEWRGLVIESTESGLYFPQLYSAIHPESVRGSLVSFDVKWGLHIFYAENRQAGQRWTIDRLIYYYNWKREVSSEQNRNRSTEKRISDKV